MSKQIDKYARAKRVADQITRELFGEDAVPSMLRTGPKFRRLHRLELENLREANLELLHKFLAHECWLQHYCVAISECEEK